jgi:trehalose 6-phosphate synthase
VTARDDEDGVLVLSQFAGASRELRDALIVNPYDIEQLADSIRRGLEMDPDDRRARMARMRRSVLEHNVYRWAGTLIGDLADIRPSATVTPFRLEERVPLRAVPNDERRPERAFG